MIRDKDWEKIFTDIEKNQDSFNRYYSIMRVKLDSDSLVDMSVGLMINDDLYAYSNFALCDYFMQGRAKRCFRHLYDIYKLSPLIKFDEKFLILVGEVRKHRAQMSICPSAMPGVHVPEIITQFCDNDFYEKDYEDITSYFSADYVSYKDTIAKMREIATGSLFIE